MEGRLSTGPAQSCFSYQEGIFSVDLVEYEAACPHNTQVFSFFAKIGQKI